MDNIRCKCGKIVCQLDDLVVLVKCRHCKRYVLLDFEKLEGQGKDATHDNRPKIEFKQ